MTDEILKRLGRVERLQPARPLGGVKGHGWEQLVLPWRCRGKLLWSPSATGPLACAHQVLTLHDIAFIDVPEFFSFNFRQLYSHLIPALVRRVAKVVTVSEFSRQRIATAFGLDPDSIPVIANGVSKNFRPYDDSEIRRVRSALGLPSRFLLLQATADRRKNIHRALEAWKVAQEHIAPDVILAIAGNLERAHVFGEIGGIEIAPRAKLLGFVKEDDIGPLISAAEAFLFPSIYEGFGLPIVEAMACGTPVLTANASATRETAGDAAILVDPLDVGSIAQAIVELANDCSLREKLGAAGAQRARLFDWDVAAAQYRSLFTSLARSE